MTDERPMGDDVRMVARFCRTHLEPHVERDWGVRAGSLEWSCRETAAHIADALGFYTAHLASNATEDAASRSFAAARVRARAPGGSP